MTQVTKDSKKSKFIGGPDWRETVTNRTDFLTNVGREARNKKIDALRKKHNEHIEKVKGQRKKTKHQ